VAACHEIRELFTLWDESRLSSFILPWQTVDQRLPCAYGPLTGGFSAQAEGGFSTLRAVSA
jgi:hypothetical protein